MVLLITLKTWMVELLLQIVNGLKCISYWGMYHCIKIFNHDRCRYESTLYIKVPCLCCLKYLSFSGWFLAKRLLKKLWHSQEIMIRLTMRILEQYNLNINDKTGNVKDRKIYKLLIATNYRDFCSSILTYILTKDVT